MGYLDIILDQTKRALWEAENVIKCASLTCLNDQFCEMPVYKHIYHMVHSLDKWMINPDDPGFKEPDIHSKDLNNLDVKTEKKLTGDELLSYFQKTKEKILAFLTSLSEDELLSYPKGCAYARFTLILAQHRHLHTHMGMIMGFIVAKSGKWPTVLGLTRPIPDGDFERFC